MTALAADKTSQADKEGKVRRYPVEDNVLIYKGALINIDTSGYIRPARDQASEICIGIAEEHADNTSTGPLGSSHTAGGIFCRVRSGRTFLAMVTSGATQATVGATVYVTDSGTVSTSSTNGVVVGICCGYNSSTSIDVFVPLGPAGISGVSGLTATSAEINTLHSVAAGTTSASKALVVGASKNLDVLTVTNLTTTQEHFGAATAEAYSATVSIDSTKGMHRIAGANGTSATSTFNATTTGADDQMTIEVTSTAAGTCTITFGTNFKSSGTLAVTASHYASVQFISDGTNWKEQTRSAIIAS
jgi:hypothetical protein